MISPDALAAWRSTHPWHDDGQVEQDLIMTRVAIEISNHPVLGDRLVWRGGTCLHKLFLTEPLRYSEDLDYVAYDLSVADNDMGRLRKGIREVAERIGLEVAPNPKTTRSRLSEHLRFTSQAGTTRRIKIEINLDEVPAAEPLEHRRLAADTDWWSGSGDVLTFAAVELIATKFRALAQRSKGRDLNDLDIAHRQLGLDDGHLGRVAAHYLFHAGVSPAQFRARLAAHLTDPDFVADTGVYLTDPSSAVDPAVLVNRWIIWSDRHLDLAHARIAHDSAPSKRKQRALADLETRLAGGASQCPIHEHEQGNWRRCDQLLNAGECPDHGTI